MIKTGVVSVSFRSLSADEVIKCVKDAGLSAIEWGSDVHAPYTDVEKLKHIAAAQKEAGIVCSSYGTYFTLGKDPVEELHGYIAAAKQLGTNILRLWCGNKEYGELTEEERDFMRSEARAAAKIAEEDGAVLCMECHNNSYTATLDGALDLMRATDSKAFRMYWQPSVFEPFEFSAAYAEGIAAYTQNIHVFYYENGKHLPLECGASDWEKYLEYFDGSQTLLLEFMPDGKPESLATEAKTLNSLAARLGG